MEHNLAMADRIIGDPILGQHSRVASADDENSLDLDRIFREHRVRLTRLATAITLDRDRAEDVVQDAFSGLHRNADRVSNPGGYLQRSVVNLSIKVQRRRRTASRYRPDPAPVSGIPEIDETWDAVRRLPPRQRAVVALRYWEDLSEAQIAASQSSEELPMPTDPSATDSTGVDYDIAAPVGSYLPVSCEERNEGPCNRYAELPVADGVSDFYVGPERLGTPVVSLDEFGRLVRCATLDASATTCAKLEGYAGVGLTRYPSNVTVDTTDIERFRMIRQMAMRSVRTMIGTCRASHFGPRSMVGLVLATGHRTRLCLDVSRVEVARPLCSKGARLFNPNLISPTPTNEGGRATIKVPTGGRGPFATDLARGR
jgi:DNA-directed RNA polymerase specialized sigma24 family protein